MGEFARKHNITPWTRPDEYASLFLPFKNNMVNGKEMVSLELFTKWTNMKVMLAGAGKGESCYREFHPFTVEEVQQHLGLYVFNGVAPSSQIELKFKQQQLDKCMGTTSLHGHLVRMLSRGTGTSKPSLQRRTLQSINPVGSSSLIGRYVLFLLG